MQKLGVIIIWYLCLNNGKKIVLRIYEIFLFILRREFEKMGEGLTKCWDEKLMQVTLQFSVKKMRKYINMILFMCISIFTVVTFQQAQKQSPEANKACNFIIKETLTQVFSCELSEISKNTFCYRALLLAASVSCLYFPM